MTEEVLKWLNGQSLESANEVLRKCCGAGAWVAAMLHSRPYANVAAFDAAVDTAFDSLTRADWLAAFSSHPRIGELNSTKMNLAGNKEWSAAEQSGMNSADDSTIERMAVGNRLYQEKFGYPYIVFATGKTSVEMCELVFQRLENEPAIELAIASSEQKRITHLRVTKLSL